MIFYYAPKTVSLACHIALEEAHAEYDTHVLDFANTEQQSPEYLHTNPKGRVPALVTEQGILTETPAILLYLAQTYPEAALAPLGNSFQLAKVQEFNLYLCATVHVAHAHRVRGYRWVDDESSIKAMQKKVPETMAQCFDLIENEMFKGPWVQGENYTICDPYLFTVSNWLQGDGVALSDYPDIAAFNARMRQREAVAKVIKLHSLEN